MNDSHAQKDEIKLSTVLQLIIDYTKEVLRFWWLILILALLVAAYRYYEISQKEGIYTARLTFMLNSGGSNNVSPLSGIMGQFGISSPGNSNLGKMGKLMTSRKIIFKSLFSEAEMTVDGKKKKDFFANHYINLLGMRDNWKENEESLYDFKFTHAKVDSFSRRENSIANSIFGQIVNFTSNGGLEQAHLSSNFTSTDTEIVELTFVSTSEEFSLLYLDRLFNLLDDYYVARTIEKQKATLELVLHRTDSLKSALTRKENQLAGVKDSSKGIFKAKSYLNQNQLARDIGTIQSMYMEAQRSLESARMALQVKRPYVQEIDRPIYPLPYYKEAYLKGTLLGAFIGGILAVFLILGRRVVLDILAREKREVVEEDF